MPKEFWVVAALAAGVLVALHVEWRRHRRAIARIPIRIHVNGTRGKSSVTRLIAAALRAQGIPTVAKTTGTSPRLILPDGTEQPVPRDGRPNISELIRTMRRAARLGARAVVFECMAVDPDLQLVAENEIVRPTMTVVTNARLDHTDAQGGTPRDIAKAFPVRPGGTLITSDPLVAEVHRAHLEAEGGSVHVARDAASVDPAGMRYLEHPENLALVLEVARLAGVASDAAAKGLGKAEPDPGVASVIDVPDATGTWTLVNLFAANDPESTFRALETVQSVFGLPGKPLFLFVSRGDRTARSAEFARALAENESRFSVVVVWGERTPAVARRFFRSGIAAERILDARSCPPDELVQGLTAEMDGCRTVIGMGNIIGPAHRLLEHLAERLEESAAKVPLEEASA